jgi:hypothetical protein
MRLLKYVYQYLCLSKDFKPLFSQDLDVENMSRWVLLRLIKELGSESTLEEALYHVAGKTNVH